MTDAESFEAFVRRYQDMVFATAVRLVGNPAEAEDVAQTVFLRAFERFDRLATSPGVAGWLKTVATNVSLNYLSRYRARWRFFSELDGKDDGADGRFEAHLEADLPVLVQPDPRVSERLEQALRDLPDHQRVPLVLFHFEERSYQDIAAALGVSLGKVKTDIHRGREALRKQLGDEHGSR